MLHHTLFTGRESELSVLRRQAAACRAGAQGICLVSGPAGIGKTTLVQQLRQEEGFQFAEARLSDGAGPSWGAIAALLRQLLRVAPRQELTLLPYLGGLLPELDSRPAGPAVLTAAIRELVHSVARRQPLLLLLEDLHWAEQSALDLLPHLFQSAGEAPFFLVLTTRDDMVQPRLRWLRTELRRLPGFRELALSCFDEAGTRRLAEHRLREAIHPAFASRLHRQTDGIPLFIDEICRALRSRGLLTSTPQGLALEDPAGLPIPETIRDSVALQLDSLPADARRQVELAATIDDEFELELLMEAAGTDAGIDELLALEMLVEVRPGTARFRHQLTREAVRQEILWSRRRALHRRVAEALERRQEPPARTGYYWLHAGEITRAREAFLSGAQRYCRGHAYHDAARLARQALELWPRGEDESRRLPAMEHLAHCAMRSGQLRDAILVWREIVGSPLLRDYPRKAGEAHRALAACYGRQNSWQPCKHHRQLAAEAFEQAERWAEASVEWLALAERLVGDLLLPDALAAAGRAGALAERGGVAALEARAMGLRGYILAMQGAIEEAKALAGQAVDLALRTGHSEAIAEAYRRLAGVLEFASQFNASARAYETTLAICHRNELTDQAMACLGCVSWVLFRLGEWKRCLDLCREATAIPREDRDDSSAAHLLLGLLHAFRGETRSARRHLDRSHRTALRRNHPIILLLLHWGRALVSELEGDPAAAADHYRQLLAAVRQSGDRHDSLPALVAAAACFAEQGRKTDLDEVIDLLAEWARHAPTNPETNATLALALGAKARLREALDEARLHLDQAIALFEQTGVPLQEIEARHQLALVCLELDRPGEAAAALQTARQQAKRLGARPLAARLEARLNDLSAPPQQPPPPSAPAGLTRRQHEVLRELAAGHSNKEIAASLHLSTRTVDMHVGHILDRLNCRSRTEAARLAAEMEWGAGQT